MKKIIGSVSLLLILAACQDTAGERTYNTTEITTQRAPTSDPNGTTQTMDSSTGSAHDSSTVISYDTSAKAKHN